MEKSCEEAFVEYSTSIHNNMTSTQVINSYSSISLAYVGDAVFDLYIRSNLAKLGLKVNILHRTAIKYVNAKSQSTIISELEDELTEDEKGVYRRGRNTTTSKPPKNADITDYRKATGFEALIGYLYIKGDIERLLYFLQKATNIIENR